MAAHNEEIAIKIGAKDEASPKIEQLAKKIDGLEADEARIIVSADTRKLQDQLDRARIKLGTLTGDEYSVQARLVGTLDADLKESKDLLDKLDGQTATVKIDSAGAKQGIDDLGKSADSSKSVLANMVGNTTQDLGELGGVAGSTGVAIGQMGEYMADAAGSGEKLSAILKNFAGVAVPIVAISGLVKGLQEKFANIAKIKAFRAKEVEAYADALEDADTTLGAIKAKLEAGKGLTANWFGKDEDVTGVFTELGLQVDQTAKLIEGGVPAIDAWAAAMKAAGVDADGIAIAVRVLKTNVDDLATATENETKQNQFFSEGLLGGADSLADRITATAELRDAQKDQADAAADAAEAERDAMADLAQKSRDAARDLHDLRDANRLLRDDLDKRDAYLNLMDAFDDMKTKGREAWDAAATGADDAESKARIYEQAQIDVKNGVLDYTEAIGEVPKDKTTNLLAEVEAGQLDTLKTDLDLLTLHTHEVKVNVSAQIDPRLEDSRFGTVRTQGTRTRRPSLGRPPP